MDQLLWKDRDVNVKHKEYDFVSINMLHGIFSDLIRDWNILSTVFDLF